MSGTFLGTGLGGGFFPAAAAPSALAPVYELKFDGIDDYGEIGAAGSVPAALQFQADTESWTCILVVRTNTSTNWRLNFSQGTTQGWWLGGNSSLIQCAVRGVSNRATGLAYLNRADVMHDEYRCIGMQWDHATSTISMDMGGMPAAAVTTTGSVGAINYSSANAEIVYLSGGIAQVGVWTGTHLADIDVLWNGGAFVNWSTHTTPPDVLHYLIGSDDDATTTDGIQDRTGNGLHMTIINAVAGNIALRSQPRY